jgi:hypothetical protein
MGYRLYERFLTTTDIDGLQNGWSEWKTSFLITNMLARNTKLGKQTFENLNYNSA